MHGMLGSTLVMALDLTSASELGMLLEGTVPEANTPDVTSALLADGGIQG